MRRRDEVLVGMLTLVAVALLVGGMLWLARGGLASGYPVYAKFDWGAGLKQGQPVLFSGANIGYVDDVHLLDDGGIVVLMRIYKKQHVPLGSIATIEPNGIFGDQLIALHTKVKPNGQFVAAGDTIESGRGGVQLAEVIARMDSIAKSANQLIATINKDFAAESPLKSIRLAAGKADSMFAMISRVAAEQSKQLGKTQDALLHAVDAIDSARIAPVVAELQKTSANANKLIEAFGTTNTKLSSILAKVDSGDGSMSRMLNSGKMEADTRALLTRLDSLMADFMKNPRKYIKLSIF